MIVNVKVPDALTTPLPLTKVWKLPKLEPVGVFKLVGPNPVNVIMSALPMFRNVTELVPLPLQPAHVKVPDVEKVTGSALASDIPSENIARSNAPIRVALKRPAMLLPFVSYRLNVRTTLSEGTPDRVASTPRFQADTFKAAGQTQPESAFWYFGSIPRKLEERATSNYFFP